jgi:hypothetical protein
MAAVASAGASREGSIGLRTPEAVIGINAVIATPVWLTGW